MNLPECCQGCPYARRITTGPAVGYNNGQQWTFIGCHHTPYRGKWIKEIKKCPRDETREAVKSE